MNLNFSFFFPQPSWDKHMLHSIKDVRFYNMSHCLRSRENKTVQTAHCALGASIEDCVILVTRKSQIVMSCLLRPLEKKTPDFHREWIIGKGLRKTPCLKLKRKPWLEGHLGRLTKLHFGKQRQRSGGKQLLRQKKNWRSFRTKAGIDLI